MTKRKARTNQKPAAITRRGKQGNRPSNNTNPQVDKISRQICSITDPFCPAARGSRWPDPSSQPTLPITLEGMINLTTDDNGNAAVLFFPVYPFGYAVATTIDNTTGNATFPDPVAYAGTLALADRARAARLVSGGVKFTSTASLSTSQGILKGIQISGSGGSGPNSYETCNIYSFAETAVSTKPVREDGSMYGYFKPSGPEARSFASAETAQPDITDLNTGDWTPLLFVIQGGAPNTTIAMGQYMIHFELVFVQNDVFNRIASRPPPPSPLLTSASAAVSSALSTFIQGGAKQIEETFMSKAKSYLMAAGMRAVGGLLGGPAGSAMAAITYGTIVD